MTDRVGRLAEVLRACGIDAFMGQTSVTMGYLHGLHEDGHERFLSLAIRSNGNVRLIAPSLTETQARRAGVLDIRVWRDGEDPAQLIHDLALDWNLESAIIAVDDAMPAHMLLKLQEIMPAALFKTGGQALAELTSKKDGFELENLRYAAKIADDAYEEVLLDIRPGMTELEVERLLTAAMEKRGGAPFFCIVAAGAGAAEPHHLSNATRIAEGEVLLLDFGCDYKGYKSDITRCVAIGEPAPEALKVYAIVHDAHMAARQAIKPGASGADVDAAARRVIDEAGYGPQFFHRTGHGIGMQGHEHPNIVSTNLDPLVAGNVFSIEPGIYLPGRFGIRIENIVAVTESGHDSLNVDPRPYLQILQT